MRSKFLAIVAATLAVLVCPTFTSCTSPPGSISVGAVRPTVEVLAPYTVLGIQTAHDLTEDQKAEFLREFELLRLMLQDGAAGGSAGKAEVGALSARASPELLALACIEPTTGWVYLPGDPRMKRNAATSKGWPGRSDNAWGGPRLAACRSHWSWRGQCTEF